MILISLMLAATPTPPTGPDDARRRQAPRPGPAAGATRSKRLIELEETIKSLPVAVAEPRQDADPQGL
jgi:hypothetical protein